jgi:hypothetical protein
VRAEKDGKKTVARVRPKDAAKPDAKAKRKPGGVKKG